MTITELLHDARSIWGNKKLSLEQILVRYGVVLGDISRHTRDRQEGGAPNEAELKKELGNVLFSTIRWCDDLGYDPEECIALAKQAQAKYQQRTKA